MAASMRSSVLSRGASAGKQFGSLAGWLGRTPGSLTRPVTSAKVTTETSPGAGAPKVVILGGGFGGLYTAVRLCSLFWPRGKKPQVTLVDQGERFVFKPLLYELLSGTASEFEVAPTYTQLLAPYPVRFIQAKVQAAEPEQLLRDGGSAGGGVVQLEGGHQLEYDWLVVALGAQADPRGVPGVMDLAIPFNTLQDALRVRDALDSIEAAAGQAGDARRTHNIMVVGAGYAGVELACVVAERVRNKGLQGIVQVSLVTPGSCILDGSPMGQRQAAEQVLFDLGISITTGKRVCSVERAPDGLEDCLPTSVVVNLDDMPGSPGRQTTPITRSNDVADAAASVASSVVATAAKATVSALRSPDQATSQVVPPPPAVATSITGTDNKATSSDAGRGATEASSQGSEQVHTAASAASAASASGQQQVAADLVLWTAGSSPVTKTARKGFPFPTNNKGSVATDATLRVMSHARVFALGDVCVAEQGFVQPPPSSSEAGREGSTSRAGSEPPQGSTFPATAQVAFQQADYVAWNVWASIAGRPLLPFRYQHLGSMMSLGTFNAAVELPFSLPEPLTSTIQSSPVAPLLSTLGVKLTNTGAEGGVTLEGPLAALLRRAAYLYRQPTNEQRLNVATEWASQAANIAQGAVNIIQQRIP